MSFTLDEDRPDSRIDSHLHDDEQRTLAADALRGLTRSFKELPPKHFYDERGAELFDRICELPEYYQTRTERHIIESNAADIAAACDAVELVELGSGTASKTRLLIEAMCAQGSLRHYIPMDVTESMIRACADALPAAYPGLRVHGVIGDFERHLDRLPNRADRRLIAFLGGTIGNFKPAQRSRFLGQVRALLAGGDHLLMGVDLVKDPALLTAAYDDAQGITAQFNLNLLHVLNRELDGNFDPEDFEHVAIFDSERQWIEMRLRSRREHVVALEAIELEVPFAAGEEMRTEISAKFSRAGLESELAGAGLELKGWYSDPESRFALTLSGPAGS